MLLSQAAESPAEADAWAYEVKWDGFRAIVESRGQELELWSRGDNNFSAAFPEFAHLVHALGEQRVTLDSEVVCMDATGRPSFARIRRRWLAGRKTAVALARELPATLVIFDVLRLGERSLLGLSYEDRRAELSRLKLVDRHWLTTAYHVGDGTALRAESQRLGIEGLVAKRLRSRYRPGIKSPDWLKLKNYTRASFVIGGWIPSSAGQVEALLVGTRLDGVLKFAGTVEFGMFGHRQRLRELLALIATETVPFVGRIGPRRANYVQPRLTAKVRFLGLDAGVLREAIFEEVGLASDPV
jgi:bifunctional non-homologous end joining protein LigD